MPWVFWWFPEALPEATQLPNICSSLDVHCLTSSDGVMGTHGQAREVSGWALLQCPLGISIPGGVLSECWGGSSGRPGA